MRPEGGVGLAENKGAPAGGRNFLPLPILASVVFIVLAAGSSQITPTGTEPGGGKWPNMAQLWAKANSGQLDTNETYFAKDVIDTIQANPTSVTMTFRSLHGHEFTLEYFNWAMTAFGLRVGSEVAVEFECEDGNWTVPFVFPASYLP